MKVKTVPAVDTVFVAQMQNVEKLEPMHVSSYLEASAWSCWQQSEKKSKASAPAWRKEEENPVASIFIPMAKIHPAYFNTWRLQLGSVSPLVSPPRKLSCNQVYSATGLQSEGACRWLPFDLRPQEDAASRRYRCIQEKCYVVERWTFREYYSQTNGHVVSSTHKKGFEQSQVVTLMLRRRSDEKPYELRYTW